LQSSKQKDDAERDHCYTLKNAQRARRKQKNVLGVERKSHHAGTSEKTCEI
jgi:hypothetical protein